MDGKNDPVNGRVKEDAAVAADPRPGGPAVDRTFHSGPLCIVERDLAPTVPPRSALVSFIRERLEQHPHFRGRTALVHVELLEETIVLSGRLPSHYLKQLLQEAILLISDAVLIDNRVAVMRPSRY